MKLNTNKLYYLCHPFTTHGNKIKNLQSARRIGKNLTKQGVSIINPILLPLGETWEDAMRKCMVLLSACDAIILCKGWDHSKGCQAEYNYAKGSGIETIEF